MNPENNATEQQQTIPTNPITESKTIAPATGTAEMTFNKKEHDFGVINPDSKVDYTFKFKNTGKEDLVISNAQGSCGCTIPEYPKEAIKPGESGKIKVSFNSAGKSGNQQKSVTITANTEVGKELLTIKAQIK
jgi:outer membrane biosynthesis protein TonB